MTSKSKQKQYPSCPCCSFLRQDLFLPPQPATTSPSLGSFRKPENDQGSADSVTVTSPVEALQSILEYAQQLKQQQEGAGVDIDDNQKPPMLLVDTHNHAHLRRERHSSYISPEYDSSSNLISFVSLTLAVEADDWHDALQHSASLTENNDNNNSSNDDNQQLQQQQHQDWTLMGLGIHPWYLTGIEPDGLWKKQLEDLLLQHPSAIVGEIGLCKMAKCARSHPEGKARGFEIQRSVLEIQLNLATQYRRPVSIHCVQQHGVFLELLQEIAAKAKAQRDADPSTFVPPAIAMHSFTGTAHHVKALLQWEATLFGEGPNDSKKKKNNKRQQSNQEENEAPSSDQRRAPLLYFGFSHIVNYEMCTSEKAIRQGQEAVRSVPLDRLLAESDVHHPMDVPAGTAGAISYMAWALDRSIPEVAEITARNGLAYLQSHLSSSSLSSSSSSSSAQT